MSVKVHELPAVALTVPPPARPVRAPARALARDDAWPRTTRVLPWAVAIFVAMLWLVPFYSVQTPIPLGVDGKLDRLLLPVLVAFWVACMITGKANAPRIRPTAIHAGVGAFLCVALVSVFLNLEVLNNLDELDLAFKKLALLGSYAVFFLVVASSVQPAEVRHFRILIVLLACVAAVGTIYEYRTYSNVFYEWLAAVLPPSFDLTNYDYGGVDSIGRRLIVGPTQHGLEVVSILAMALPFAVVGAMGDRSVRSKVFGGVASAVILAGMVATFRKTALVAPLGALVVLFAYRPRQTLGLVPVGFAMIVLIHFMVPGALGSVAVQLKPNRFQGAGTVQDRKSDYDAVRPDILKRPFFGRGHGTYDPYRYRFLDNEWVHRIVETGFLGAAAYLALILSVIATAHRSIRRRAGPGVDVALAVAAAAGAYATSNLLFDTLAFPHAPYVFLFMAGLMAAAVNRDDAPAAAPGAV